MKRQHKVNWGWAPPGQPYRDDDRYDQEIASALRKAETAWKREAKALTTAERRQQHRDSLEGRAEVIRLREVVQARLDELNAVRAQMENTGTAHGSHHSGRRSVRRVGQPPRSL